MKIIQMLLFNTKQTFFISHLLVLFYEENHVSTIHNET